MYRFCKIRIYRQYCIEYRHIALLHLLYFSCFARSVCNIRRVIICCKVCLLGWQCSSQLRKFHLFPPQIAKGCVVKPDRGARIRTSSSSCGASTSLASRPSKPKRSEGTKTAFGRKKELGKSSQFCNVVLLYDML